MSMIRFVLFLLFLPFIAFADIPEWQILPCKSELNFTAIQNNSPTSGQFSFTGSGHFDPVQLAKSDVKINVDLSSVLTPAYQDVQDTLKTPDWFDVKVFPSATFTSTTFTLLNKDNANYQSLLASKTFTDHHVAAKAIYQVDGQLTLHGKTMPLSLIFALTQETGDTAEAFGIAKLQRLQFDIGKKWGTDLVKDEVNLDFHVVAMKSKTKGEKLCND